MSSQDNPFGLYPGRKIIGKYIVGDCIGKGWEGQVYRVTEAATRIERAAKFFYPERNPGGRTLRRYAQKLDRLRHCPMIVRYHTHEHLVRRGQQIPFLVSEFVHGEILEDFIKRQPRKRLTPFEALHLLHALVVGMEPVHAAGEYHGDLHSGNIMVTRRGIGFDVKAIDFFWHGPRTVEHVQDDIVDLIKLFYESLGGARTYKNQPPEVKAIVRGQKRSLITRRFKTLHALRQHLENFDWSS